MSIALLLNRSIPGAKSSIDRHIERGERIAGAIQERFSIAEPRQWKAKHLRWILSRWITQFSQKTQYDYWLTTRVLASALGRWPDWKPHLHGSWCRDGVGGKPAKLARNNVGAAKSIIVAGQETAKEH